MVSFGWIPTAALCLCLLIWLDVMMRLHDLNSNGLLEIEAVAKAHSGQFYRRATAQCTQFFSHQFLWLWDCSIVMSPANWLPCSFFLGLQWRATEFKRKSFSLWKYCGTVDQLLYWRWIWNRFSHMVQVPRVVTGERQTLLWTWDNGKR